MAIKIPKIFTTCSIFSMASIAVTMHEWFIASSPLIGIELDTCPIYHNSTIQMPNWIDFDMPKNLLV